MKINLNFLIGAAVRPELHLIGRAASRAPTLKSAGFPTFEFSYDTLILSAPNRFDDESSRKVSLLSSITPKPTRVEQSLSSGHGSESSSTQKLRPIMYKSASLWVGPSDLEASFRIIDHLS